MGRYQCFTSFLYLINRKINMGQNLKPSFSLPCGVYIFIIFMLKCKCGKSVHRCVNNYCYTSKIQLVLGCLHTNGRKKCIQLINSRPVRYCPLHLRQRKRILPKLWSEHIPAIHRCKIRNKQQKFWLSIRGSNPVRF